MKQPPFSRILIANRGEIATRIARACFELHISTISIYAYEDRFSLHRYKTDESYRIGELGKPLDAYLNIDAIIRLAIKHKIDAIHPGYGFLSENPEFAKKCEENSIKFIGPTPKHLQLFGDKTAARAVAKKAGLQIIPGSFHSLQSIDEAQKIALELKFPVVLKSVTGGGGKGIRIVSTSEELKTQYTIAKSEAKTSFGQDQIYLEKAVTNSKHIEVQILGDQKGNIVHLFERDCSIQRRHQKVVEVAPCQSISESLREKICNEALKIAKHVNYQGLGTVEFLLGEDKNLYFLEVNPRVQVEHTVTEMITGVDLIQASILVAGNEPLSNPNIGICEQKDLKIHGSAIQCRITTENPKQNFAPDTGHIIAYRAAFGFGIRLDEGHGTSGGIITPHYDSLLVKVTSSGPNLSSAAAKMYRCLSEFRIRGVQDNIGLLKKVMTHPSFLKGDYSTDFFTKYPEVFSYVEPRDRATKVLRYIAQATINDPHKFGKNKNPPSTIKPKIPNVHSSPKTEKTAKMIYDSKGKEALKSWIKSHPHLLLTDTTMRDAHQSLFATRLRTCDILKIADYYRSSANQFFSLEVWGGATFDTCLRFLKEDPWQRLKKIRKAIPNILLQMLIRGDNAVGYTKYPEWVIRDFIKETIDHGLEVFRVFDCLNQPHKMAIAIDEINKHGAIAEASICYTGDLLSPSETKYTLEYYNKQAKQLKDMGVDIIAIKDMAGLLRPNAAPKLVKRLFDSTDLPIHLHTHDTTGTGVAMLLKAHEAGCHIVDGAISSMAGLTSQPSLNALVASLADQKSCPQVPISTLDNLARFWQETRKMYEVFDPGVKSTSTDVYQHEIPGGQYSNLYQQALQIGLSSDQFYELTCRYKEVNQLFGNIIKVTPSSKVVGDMALLLHKSNLTGATYLRNKPQLDYPDSVINFFKGDLGTPMGGFPEEIKELVLSQVNISQELPSQDFHLTDSFNKAQTELEDILGRTPKKHETLSYRLYPRVFLDFIDYIETYGPIAGLSTPVFFYGMLQGEEIEFDLEPGKTLYISLEGISKTDSKGKKSVFFKLNGFNRMVKVADQNSTLSQTQKRQKKDPHNSKQIGTTMPGKILKIYVKEKDFINKGHNLMLIESMKMECMITSKSKGTIKKIFQQKNDLVETNDLLVELE